MGGGNRGLWVLLCVLVVVVLVLAAMLLPGWGSSGRSAAAAPAAVATVLGGAASRLLRSGRKKRTILGGGPDDLDQPNIDLGADGLGFPDIQKNPAANVQESHHQARVLLKKAFDQYVLERNDSATGEAKVGPNAPVTPLGGVPKRGWAQMTNLVNHPLDWFSNMCDIVRGDFNFIGSTYRFSGKILPDYPWNNDFDLDGSGSSGDTRMDRWKDTLSAIVNELDGYVIPGLVDGFSDLRSKALFQKVSDYMKDSTKILAPNTPKLGPPPVIDSTWSGVNDASHPLDTKFSPQLITSLSTCLNLYIDPSNDLRDGGKFNVGLADRAVETVIDNTNHILGLTNTSTKVTLARHHEMLKTVSGMDPALIAWANEIFLAAQDSKSGKTAEYTALFNAIGGDSTTTMIAGSLRDLVHTYLNAPKWEKPAAIPARTALVASSLSTDYSLTVKNKMASFDQQFRELRKAYVKCRVRYELEWVTLDPLYTALERSVDTLTQHYNNAASWANREQSAKDLLALKSNAKGLDTALNNDPTLSVNLTGGATSATATSLITEIADLQTLADALLLPTTSNPVSSYAPAVGVPSTPTKITDLMDVVQYNISIVDVGKQVRRVLKTVFHKSKTGWEGIRNQYWTLRGGIGHPGANKNNPLVDPASDVYVKVAIAAQTFAQACFDFADKGDPAKIQDAEQAKKELKSELTKLAAEVSNSALLDDAFASAITRKNDFKAAIQRTLTALNAVPELKLPDQGNSASPQVARPLTESQRLIHYKSAPSDSVAFASNTDSVAFASDAVSASQNIVIEAKTSADLENMVAQIPKQGPRLAYGLIVDRPGDMTALYKAVAIRLNLRLPPEFEKKVADRKNAATGWLYDIVRFETGAYYTRMREYIKPELYAV